MLFRFPAGRLATSSSPCSASGEGGEASLQAQETQIPVRKSDVSDIKPRGKRHAYVVEEQGEGGLGNRPAKICTQCGRPARLLISRPKP